MDLIHNVPSIEEISFKLTENFIPSQLHLPYNHPHDDSLDYTISKVSIQQLLLDEEEQFMISQPQDPSYLEKQFSLKTTCAGTTEPSSIKKTSKATFRHRALSSQKSDSKPKINRRLSQHMMTVRG
jgi:hypothetical protein